MRAAATPADGVPTRPDTAAARLEETAAFLASTELFSGVNAAALRELAAEVEWLPVRGGELVCRQGEPGNSLFLVATGKLRVLVRSDEGGERVVQELGRGDNVGEMSLLTGNARSATVQAVRDSLLARITRERFDRLLEEHPVAVLSLTRMLARWLGRANERSHRATLPTTIAVRSASAGVPLREFTARLAHALGAMAPTLLLRAETLDTVFYPGAADEDEGGAAHQRITQWLSEQEVGHRFVLYEAAPDRPGWSRRCARQADRLLSVVWTGDDPGDAHHATESVGSAAQTNLVLLHPAGTAQPRGTWRWRPQQYDAHHHVRVDALAHYERLARHLTGRAVGLVLGGGGARGFAHLGVARAMGDLGLPIDRIGGTSMGALLGALVAMELDHETLVRRNQQTWPRLPPNRDLTIPLISLMAGRKGRQLVHELYHDMAVEDLWIPFFCCSANLTRSELVVHRHGSLAEAARASSSLPGVAPPVVTAEGELLVDGGILSNVPADVMLEQGMGAVIAVDVSPKGDLSLDGWGGVLPSAGQVLASRLHPFGPRKPYPNILHILTRASTLSSLRLARRVREQVDLYLEPPVGDFDLFAWDSVAAIANVGYTHALEPLHAWVSARP